MDKMIERQKQEELYTVIKTVDDPELPSVSVVDLGMVREVNVHENHVSVSMVPTFAGCPALDFIELKVKKAVEDVDWVDECTVHFSFQHQWSTDSITEEGKYQLKSTGLLHLRRTIFPGRNGLWTARLRIVVYVHGKCIRTNCMQEHSILHRLQ